VNARAKKSYCDFRAALFRRELHQFRNGHPFGEAGVRLPFAMVGRSTKSVGLATAGAVLCLAACTSLTRLPKGDAGPAADATATDVPGDLGSATGGSGGVATTGAGGASGAGGAAAAGGAAGTAGAGGADAGCSSETPEMFIVLDRRPTRRNGRWSPEP
jgi:hypothetical protein